MTKPILLIDARNVVYRSIYAGEAVRVRNRYAVPYHFFTLFLRQVAGWINKFQPTSVMVFWDAPRKTVWRRQILETYKDRPPSNMKDITEDLARVTTIAQEYFKVMNVRQFEREEMEADDLIYAATTVLHPRPTVIISSDSDMVQIPFSYSSSKIFNPLKSEETAVPEYNPIMLKALVGDKTDVIDGYMGIGPVKGKRLLDDWTALQQFLEVNGRKTYNRNILLIDLSLCPRLLANKLYFQRHCSDKVEFSKPKINELTNKYKVNGILAEFTNIVLPFQNLV